MRVFIAGGSGLIGRRMIELLKGRGDQPVLLSRRAEKLRVNPQFRGIEVLQGDPTVAGAWEKALDGCDGVVNLAGHGIFSERWNSDVKKKIRESRVRSTETIVSAILNASSPPKVLVNGSAIGAYGPMGDEELDENAKFGNDFMAGVVRDWEAAAQPVQESSTRLALVRTGVVLAEHEGALAVMAPIFRALGGTPIGSGKKLVASGKQWLSWIHLDDIAGIFLLALDSPEARGPINGTSPHPLTNADFSLELSKALRTFKPLFGALPWPRYLPIGPPDFVLALVLGEVSNVITTGQRVYPKKALSLGYQFKYPELPQALEAIFKRTKSSIAATKQQEPELAGAAAGTGS